jgi:hypothetical protein
VLNQTGISETTPEMPETPGTTLDMIQGISKTGRTTTPGDGAGTVIATLTATLSATNDQGTTLSSENRGYNSGYKQGYKRLFEHIICYHQRINTWTRILEINQESA